MKVRILFAFDPVIACGEVYDLAEGEALARIANGDAEAVDKKTAALADPRTAPAAEPEAPAAEIDAA